MYVHPGGGTRLWGVGGVLQCRMLARKYCKCDIPSRCQNIDAVFSVKSIAYISLKLFSSQLSNY